MSVTTQFAMVEELANLVKDNLRSKHMVLSMEDAFIDFLTHHDSSSDGVLEVEPMDPYNRLLLHRLADIFGFTHVSIGEGENRHLILEKCSETSIPSILVSDILFQYDDPHSLRTSYQVLRRNEYFPDTERSSLGTFEDREDAYSAARRRIFSEVDGETGGSTMQKPRSVPVVARRMIAHALGQKMSPRNQDAAVRECRGQEVKIKELNIKEDDQINCNTSTESFQGYASPAGKDTVTSNKIKISNHKDGAFTQCQQSAPLWLAEKSCNDDGTRNPESGTSRISVKKNYPKDEHLGAAKRMFTQALGLPSVRGSRVSRCKEIKQHERTES